MSFLTKSSQQQTNKTTLPPWLNAASEQAGNLAQKVGSQAYTPYTGQRIAPLSGAEQQAADLTQSSVGQAQPFMDQAAGMMGQASQRFTDADMGAYMNPFISQALDPAARQVNEQFASMQNRQNAQAASRGSFGGSRHGMMDLSRMKAQGTALQDLYGTGYARAFDTGASLWNQDQNRAQGLAGQYMGLGEMTSRMTDADLNRLYAAGGLERGIDQAGRDFDYLQHTENRDWDLRNLSAMASSLGALPHEKTQTQTTTNKGSPLSALVSAGMMLFGGPAGMAMGGKTGALAGTAMKAAKIAKIGGGG